MWSIVRTVYCTEAAYAAAVQYKQFAASGVHGMVWRIYICTGHLKFAKSLFRVIHQHVLTHDNHSSYTPTPVSLDIHRRVRISLLWLNGTDGVFHAEARYLHILVLQA